MNQQTLKAPIEYSGIEPYGGQRVDVRIEPAEPNSGIVFKTSKGKVKASLENVLPVSSFASAVSLRRGDAIVYHTEHLLAALFAYGIDNATIKIKRAPSTSFRILEKLRLATEAEVIPNTDCREKILCDAIESVGITEQDKIRRRITLLHPYKNGGLEFHPYPDIDLIVEARTNYHPIGLQIFTTEITPSTFKNELAGSRPFLNHLPKWMPVKLAEKIGMLLYPSFGIGHGFSESRIFYPVRTADEWTQQERQHAEVARHTIVDRLGAISLLPGRLTGVKIDCYLSGHKNDIITLRKMQRKNIFYELKN